MENYFSASGDASSWDSFIGSLSDAEPEPTQTMGSSPVVEADKENPSVDIGTAELRGVQNPTQPSAPEFNYAGIDYDKIGQALIQTPASKLKEADQNVQLDAESDRGALGELAGWTKTAWANFLRGAVSNFSDPLKYASILSQPLTGSSALEDAGVAIDQFTNNLVSLDAKYQNDFVAGTVSRGLGQVAGMLVGGGLIGKGVGLALRGLTTVIGGAAKIEALGAAGRTLGSALASAGKGEQAAVALSEAKQAFSLSKKLKEIYTSGSTYLMGGTEGYDAYKRSIEFGDDPMTAIAKSLGYATLAAAIEGGVAQDLFKRANGMFGYKAASDFAAATGVKAVSTGFKQFITQAAKDFGVGTAEEASQRLLQDMIVTGTPEIDEISKEGLAGGTIQTLVGAALGVRVKSKTDTLQNSADELDSIMGGDSEAAKVIREIAAQDSKADLDEIKNEISSNAAKDTASEPVPVTFEQPPLQTAEEAYGDQVNLFNAFATKGETPSGPEVTAEEPTPPTPEKKERVPVTFEQPPLQTAEEAYGDQVNLFNAFATKGETPSGPEVTDKQERVPVKFEQPPILTGEETYGDELGQYDAFLPPPAKKTRAKKASAADVLKEFGVKAADNQAINKLADDFKATIEGKELSPEQKKQAFVDWAIANGVRVNISLLQSTLGGNARSHAGFIKTVEDARLAKFPAETVEPGYTISPSTAQKIPMVKKPGEASRAFFSNNPEVTARQIDAGLKVVVPANLAGSVHPNISVKQNKKTKEYVVTAAAHPVYGQISKKDQLASLQKADIDKQTKAEGRLEKRQARKKETAAGMGLTSPTFVLKNDTSTQVQTFKDAGLDIAEVMGRPVKINEKDVERYATDEEAAVIKNGPSDPNYESVYRIVGDRKEAGQVKGLESLVQDRVKGRPGLALLEFELRSASLNELTVRNRLLPEEYAKLGLTSMESPTVARVVDGTIREILAKAQNYGALKEAMAARLDAPVETEEGTGATLESILGASGVDVASGMQEILNGVLIHALTPQQIAVVRRVSKSMMDGTKIKLNKTDAALLRDALQDSEVRAQEIKTDAKKKLLGDPEVRDILSERGMNEVGMNKLSYEELSELLLEEGYEYDETSGTIRAKQDTRTRINNLKVTARQEVQEAINSDSYGEVSSVNVQEVYPRLYQIAKFVFDQGIREFQEFNKTVHSAYLNISTSSKGVKEVGRALFESLGGKITEKVAAPVQPQAARDPVITVYTVDKNGKKVLSSRKTSEVYEERKKAIDTRFDAELNAAQTEKDKAAVQQRRESATISLQEDLKMRKPEASIRSRANINRILAASLDAATVISKVQRLSPNTRVLIADDISDVEALYDASQDTLVLYTSNIAGTERGIRLVYHELTHRNLAHLNANLEGQAELQSILKASEKVLMDSLPQLLQEAGFASEQEFRDRYKFDNSPEGNARMQGELLARYAERLADQPRPGWFSQILSKIRLWLAKNFGVNLSSDALQHWLAGNMERFANSVGPGLHGVEYSQLSKPPAWFRPTMPASLQKLGSENTDLYEALKSGSIDEAILAVQSNAPNALGGSIANMVAAKITELRAAGFQFGVEVTPEGYRLRGAYGSSSLQIKGLGERSSITVKFNHPSNGELSGTNWKTVMHELIHAATQAQIKLRPDGTAAAKVLDLFNRVVREHNAQFAKGTLPQSMKDNSAQWLANPDELLTYGFLDADFQKWMASVKVGQNKSFFTRLIEIVKDVLGLSGNVYDSALAEFMAVSDELFAEDLSAYIADANKKNLSFGYQDNTTGWPSWALGLAAGHELVWSDNDYALYRAKSMAGTELIIPISRKDGRFRADINSKLNLDPAVQARLSKIAEEYRTERRASEATVDLELTPTSFIDNVEGNVLWTTLKNLQAIKTDPMLKEMANVLGRLGAKVSIKVVDTLGADNIQPATYDPKSKTITVARDIATGRTDVQMAVLKQAMLASMHEAVSGKLTTKTSTTEEGVSIEEDISPLTGKVTTLMTELAKEVQAKVDPSVTDAASLVERLQTPEFLNQIMLTKDSNGVSIGRRMYDAFYDLTGIAEGSKVAKTLAMITFSGSTMRSPRVGRPKQALNPDGTVDTTALTRAKFAYPELEQIHTTFTYVPQSDADTLKKANSYVTSFPTTMDAMTDIMGNLNTSPVKLTDKEKIVAKFVLLKKFADMSRALEKTNPAQAKQMYAYADSLMTDLEKSASETGSIFRAYRIGADVMHPFYVDRKFVQPISDTQSTVLEDDALIGEIKTIQQDAADEAADAVVKVSDDLLDVVAGKIEVEEVPTPGAPAPTPGVPAPAPGVPTPAKPKKTKQAKIKPEVQGLFDFFEGTLNRDNMFDALVPYPHRGVEKVLDAIAKRMARFASKGAQSEKSLLQTIESRIYKQIKQQLDTVLGPADSKQRELSLPDANEARKILYENLDVMQEAFNKSVQQIIDENATDSATLDRLRKLKFVDYNLKEAQKIVLKKLELKKLIRRSMAEQQVAVADLTASLIAASNLTTDEAAKVAQGIKKAFDIELKKQLAKEFDALARVVNAPKKKDAPTEGMLVEQIAGLVNLGVLNDPRTYASVAKPNSNLSKQIITWVNTKLKIRDLIWDSATDRGAKVDSMITQLVSDLSKATDLTVEQAATVATVIRDSVESQIKDKAQKQMDTLRKAAKDKPTKTELTDAELTAQLMKLVNLGVFDSSEIYSSFAIPGSSLGQRIEGWVKKKLDFAKLVKASIEKRAEAVQEITDQFVADTGIDGDVAANVVTAIQAAVDAQIQKARAKALAGYRLQKVAAETKIKRLPYQKLLDIINVGGFDTQEIYNDIAKANPHLKLPTWDPAVVASLKKEAEKFQSMPDSDVKQERIIRFLGKIENEHIRNLSKKEKLSYYLGDVAPAIWQAGVLSGLPTQEVNFLSSGLNVEAQGVMQAAAMQFSQLLQGRISGTFGFYKDIVDATLNAARVWDATSGSRVVAAQALQTGSTRFKNVLAAPLNVLERIPIWLPHKYVGRIMAMADGMVSQMASEINQRHALRSAFLQRGMAAREITEAMEKAFNPDVAVLNQIELQLEQEAADGFFEEGKRGENQKAIRKMELLELRRKELSGDENYIADSVKTAGKWTFNDDPKGMLAAIFVGTTSYLNKATPLGRYFFSFMKTSVNIANSVIDFSPYGYFRAHNLRLSARLPDSISKYKPEAIQVGSKEYYNQMAQATAGTMLLSAVIAMVVQGMNDEDEGKEPLFAVYGSGPKSAMERRQLEESTGWRQYSFKIHGKYVRYADLPLVNLMLGSLGAICDMKRFNKSFNESSMTEKLGIGALGAVNAFFDRNMLSGISNLVDLYKNPNAKGLAALQRTFSGIVGGFSNPQFFKWARTTLEGMFDEKGVAPKLDTMSSKGFWTSMVPFNIGNDTPMLNTLGEPVTKWWLEASVDRFTAFDKGGHPVFSKLSTVGVFIKDPSKNTEIRVGTNKVPLGKSEDAYRRFIELRGQNLRQRLTPEVVDAIRNQALTIGKERAQVTLDYITDLSREYAVWAVQSEIRAGSITY